MSPAPAQLKILCNLLKEFKRELKERFKHISELAVQVLEGDANSLLSQFPESRDKHRDK